MCRSKWVVIICALTVAFLGCETSNNGSESDTRGGFDVRPEDTNEEHSSDSISSETDADEPVSDAAETGGRDSDTGFTCAGDNPAGCSSNDDCADGMKCTTDHGECISSSCTCTESGWACTDDCGGGKCVDKQKPDEPCAAQDVQPEGMCEMIIGVRWNGEKCETISGCNCSGSDCDNLYSDKEACKQERAACIQKRCGTRGAPESICDDDEFCQYPDQTCGEADRGGTCTQNPGPCPEVYAPVCGCDGKTYGNDCKAASAGVSIKHEGECENENSDNGAADGENCGGVLGITCQSGLYCKYSVCENYDQFGTCKKKPDACAAISDPVCGCDGKTYSNACKAASAGVSVKSEGECSDE